MIETQAPECLAALSRLKANLPHPQLYDEPIVRFVGNFVQENMPLTPLEELPELFKTANFLSYKINLTFSIEVLNNPRIYKPTEESPARRGLQTTLSELLPEAHEEILTLIDRPRSGSLIPGLGPLGLVTPDVLLNLTFIIKHQGVEKAQDYAQSLIQEAYYEPIKTIFEQHAVEPPTQEEINELILAECTEHGWLNKDKIFEFIYEKLEIAGTSPEKTQINEIKDMLEKNMPKISPESVILPQVLGIIKNKNLRPESFVSAFLNHDNSNIRQIILRLNQEDILSQNTFNVCLKADKPDTTTFNLHVTKVINAFKRAQQRDDKFDQQPEAKLLAAVNTDLNLQSIFKDHMQYFTNPRLYSSANSYRDFVGNVAERRAKRNTLIGQNNLTWLLRYIERQPPEKHNYNLGPLGLVDRAVFTNLICIYNQDSHEGTEHYASTLIDKHYCQPIADFITDHSDGIPNKAEIISFLMQQCSENGWVAPEAIKTYITQKIPKEQLNVDLSRDLNELLTKLPKTSRFIEADLREAAGPSVPGQPSEGPSEPRRPGR